MSLLLSTIVPTCHRDQALARCLERLAAARRQLGPERCEVIVTDDGRDPAATAAVVERFPWARVVAGPRQGPAANRNHGARQACGQWVVFLDDDCEPDEQWLRALAQLMDTGAAEVIEGRTICPDRQDDPFQEQVENLDGGQFWSCNLAVRRDVFEALGGFDEDFLEAGGEDLEFAWRIRQQGVRARFAREAVVAHPPRRIGWRRVWWRTFLMRWMTLYWIKTCQTARLQAGPLPVIWRLLKKVLAEQARTTAHLLLRFDPDRWRTKLFWQGWRWLTLPVVLPYLALWEFRFRAKLSGRPSARLGESPSNSGVGAAAEDGRAPEPARRAI